MKGPLGFNADDLMQETLAMQRKLMEGLKLLPQVAPAPVRMVSSATVAHPAAAASRIWRSVTPLQMQTYTVSAAGRQARDGPRPFHLE